MMRFFFLATLVGISCSSSSPDECRLLFDELLAIILSGVVSLYPAVAWQVEVGRRVEENVLLFLFLARSTAAASFFLSWLSL
jgi:hypothetical protein